MKTTCAVLRPSPRPLFTALALGLLILASSALALPAGAQVAPEARIHPTIPLLDKDGRNVLTSGSPVSPGTTCGECHDVEYITTHTIHSGAALGAVPTPAHAVSSRPRDPEHPEEAEMNCFLCHTPEPADDARLQALRSGRADWAATATLSGGSIVTPAEDGWSWNPVAFDGEGRVLDSLLALRSPTSANCAHCHGVADDGSEEPVVLSGLDPGDAHTLSRGEIISPQRISESGVNLVGKRSLDRPFDVHAERLMDCTNCHFSVNNPIHRNESDATQPEGLIFDSRRMPLGAYLQRPSHNFAGQSGESGRTRTSRPLSCEMCHDPEPTHRWLPYAGRHTDALACEVCHTPTLYSVAMESVDWTRLDEAGHPTVTWRGCEAGCETAATDLVRGVEPVLLLREEEDGRTRLAPYNLVTNWYWTRGEEGAPVSLELVQEASARGTEVDAVRSRLVELGVEDPHLKGEIHPHPIHHAVAAGEWATRECTACHEADSRLTRAMVLAPSTPHGEVPTFLEEDEARLAGSVEVDDDGALIYTPSTAAAGLYVLGHDVLGWANILGILVVLATLAGVIIHGGLRWRTARRQPPELQPEGPPVYMYPVYQRIWHWLQALAILVLLLTGIEIHVTRLGILDFALAVRIHNVVGFVVVANAVFAAFYNLASGQIQHYLPEPHGFFGSAIVQARYYLRGIFRGEPHPFDKSPDQKLNPLQQITYLGILNILLPLQMATGVLIWGAQRWPAVDGIFGGLVVLAPLHAVGAWLFTAFLIMHVYLTTTGPTPLANLQAMVVGWDQVEATRDEAEAV